MMEKEKRREAQPKTNGEKIANKRRTKTKRKTKNKGKK